MILTHLKQKLDLDGPDGLLKFAMQRLLQNEHDMLILLTKGARAKAKS